MGRASQELPELDIQTFASGAGQQGNLPVWIEGLTTTAQTTTVFLTARTLRRFFSGRASLVIFVAQSQLIGAPAGIRTPNQQIMSLLL